MKYIRDIFEIVLYLVCAFIVAAALLSQVGR